ncbi:MAG: enoyl-CoA hydratase-related protein [Deltaproteobacteria bacterium]|nr:enoyl-CoA hydratase-related protein [Deltaproteobacteria bacterium]
MDYKHITLETDGDLALVTMRRPEQRNALSEAHLRELLDAFRRIGDGRARGAILAAEGPVFSAGHDFSDMADRDLSEMRKLLGVCAEVMKMIQAVPQPVIAQVQGLATAAGCQLVAACDLAVASETARFQVPGGIGGWFCTTPGVALVRAVGRKHALEMLLTGDPIDAPTAMAWGLVNRVVPEGQLEKETRALLGRATRGSALSKGIGKRAFYRQVDMELGAAYNYATEVMAESSQTDDARENVRAFLEKRKPRFK